MPCLSIGAVSVFKHLSHLFEDGQQTILVAADEERGVAVTLGVTAIANIVANAILIPNYGALGAAWATLLSEVLLLAGLLGFTLRSRMGTAWLKPGALIAGVGAICTILAWTFPQGLLLGTGVYLVAVVLTQIPNLRALLDLLGR